MILQPDEFCLSAFEQQEPGQGTGDKKILSQEALSTKSYIGVFRCTQRPTAWTPIQPRIATNSRTVKPYLSETDYIK